LISVVRDILAPQWSNEKENGMNKLNKFAHGVVLVLFGAACWFVWALLQLPAMVRVHGVALQLPAFTRLCRACPQGTAGSLLLIAASVGSSGYGLDFAISRKIVAL
jgi:hypothetical protein